MNIMATFGIITTITTTTQIVSTPFCLEALMQKAQHLLSNQAHFYGSPRSKHLVHNCWNAVKGAFAVQCRFPHLKHA